jgi:hypothetical protein
MKVTDSTAAAPLPERKPTPAAPSADGQASGFGTVLAETAESGAAPLPARKPAQVLPGVKPDVPAAILANAAPLPGRKPPVSAEVAARAATAEERVQMASRQVANISGHSYAAILAQARQESGLDPKARSKTSSAAGPFQFLERTWLGLFQRYGSSYGLGDLSRQIEVRNGVPTVKDPELRQKILDLRYDADLSAGMAARYLAEGRDRLQRKLGRPVSEAESRIAYVMGVAGASKLIAAAGSGDATPAADLLPQAAKANGPLFYDRASGRALSAEETVARLTRRMESDQKALFAAIDRAAEKPVVLDGATSNPLGAFQSV